MKQKGQRGKKGLAANQASRKLLSILAVVHHTLAVPSQEASHSNLLFSIVLIC